jgi:hypothetical protein
MSDAMNLRHFMTAMPTVPARHQTFGNATFARVGKALRISVCSTTIFPTFFDSTRNIFSQKSPQFQQRRRPSSNLNFPHGATRVATVRGVAAHVLSLPRALRRR